MKRKSVCHFLAIAVFLPLSLGRIDYQNRNLILKVTIYHIPPYQSVVKAAPIPAKEGEVGGTQGTMRGGYVTRSFPDGIVLFESSSLRSNEDIARAIKDHVHFACSDVVNIIPCADVYILVDKKDLMTTLADEEYYPPPSMHGHLVREYTLDIEPLLIENATAVFKIKFAAEMNPSDNEYKVLLDQVFSLKYDKTLFVGFPSKDDGIRGTVYWLAFSFEDQAN